jgi:hypothetical protein
MPSGHGRGTVEGHLVQAVDIVQAQFAVVLVEQVGLEKLAEDGGGDGAGGANQFGNLVVA